MLWAKQVNTRKFNRTFYNEPKNKFMGSPKAYEKELRKACQRINAAYQAT